MAGGPRAAELADFDAHVADTGNPHSVTKTQVGLGNADNTSDVNKPISTATQTALDLKATVASLTSHTTNVGNPHGVTASQVGLGNVDNTSDANKPVSTATQTALDLKAPLASPTFTGTPAAPTAAAGTNTTQLATTAFVFAVAEPSEALHGSYHLLRYPEGGRWVRHAVWRPQYTTVDYAPFWSIGPVSTGTVSTPGSMSGASGRLHFIVTGSAVANNIAESRDATRATFQRCSAYPMFSMFMFRFGATPATGQGYMGYTSTTASLAWNANLQNLTNCIGIGYENGDANLSLMHNDGTSTVTKTTLGANFPVNSSAVYRLWLCANKNTSTLSYQVDRVDSWQTTSGSLASNIPAQDTGLYIRMHQSNGSTASAAVVAMYAHDCFWGVGF